jgi:hypothetical protein
MIPYQNPKRKRGQQAFAASGGPGVCQRPELESLRQFFQNCSSIPQRGRL